ncbi:hypothetical protein F511_35612 [Dorcoceras hygrometricum]|uniref:Uncharacterized protein n=1 Tax=Dorcoceras hygrometricum TaxID=472368 RepID=A0A2Z7AD68_9LAMI|nr:hypothetical protein F511_35612 [Dorcoceras hygrometricum]
MASSFYSNSQHVDFDSVLAMDYQGMVSMFQGLMASGLTGFLGCPAPCPDVPAVEEHVEQPAAEEGISADQPVEVGVGEVAAEIDASVVRDKPADTNKECQWFDLTHEELIAKWAAERIITSPADTDEEIEAEKPVFNSVEAVESVIEVEEAAADRDFLVVDDPDTVINQVLQQLDSISADRDDKSGTGAETWFDRALGDMLRKYEGAETMGVDTAGGDQQVQCSEEELVVHKTNDDLLDDDEQKLLEDILLTIPVDVPLPSAGMEITKIVMGKEIKIPEVTARTWFLNSLPKIPVDHKGKAILVKKDPIKGNPAQEHYVLICADIDLLVALRAKVIDEVAQFFNSFSLKKLATINIEEMYKKEEQVLSWGESESPQLAIQRKLYILLKYREVLVRKFLESWKSNFVPGQGSSAVDLSVIDFLSDLHLFILEELTKEARAHGLSWKKPCFSGVFEGKIRDRGAVIA